MLETTTKFATVNGRQVEITGPQAHPFKCVACEACFRQHRAAAKCCLWGSEDLRTGEKSAFCEQVEAELRAEDAERTAKLFKLYHFECSCGERFKSVDDARWCRKCRTYSEAGYCTTVTDTDTDTVMWSEEIDGWEDDQEGYDNVVANDATPLTHNPFGGLKL